MGRLIERVARGAPAAVAGAVIWADALLARVLLRADDATVYFLGHPIAVVCWLRSRLGLPCPTCGVTRSVVLTLHGEFGTAWRLAPVGPVAVAGALALATALLALGLGWRHSAGATERAGLHVRRLALVYSAITLLVWIAGWALRFRAALHAG